MRVVIQRVKSAQVTVAGEVVGRIGQGMLVFLGVAKTDTPEDADHLTQKITELRIFEDSAGDTIANKSSPDYRGNRGKMNLSAADVGAAFLVVSQFTLLGNCDKGRRPSFDDAADPAKGEELYNYFISSLKKNNVEVATGRFRAMMDVESVNDGPVTFVINSR